MIRLGDIRIRSIFFRGVEYHRCYKGEEDFLPFVELPIQHFELSDLNLTGDGDIEANVPWRMR